MPKYKYITPAHREARKIKSRRLQWIDMITQLRFGSPTAPEVAPGNCQDMLEFLVAKYWPYDSKSPIPSHQSHGLKICTDTAEKLFQSLPDEEWARKDREPKSDKDNPIFYRTDQNHLVYLDGRRRINKWYRENPNQEIQYWMIYEI